MSSKIQKLNNKTRIVGYSVTGRVMQVVEIDRRQTFYNRRYWKKYIHKMPLVKCVDITHGNWNGKNFITHSFVEV